eukprot:gene10950-12111_t
MSGVTDDKTKLINNQPYDETLSVHDDEEIASTFTPSPRPSKSRGGRNRSTTGESMEDRELLLASDDEFDHDNLQDNTKLASKEAPKKPQSLAVAKVAPPLRAEYESLPVSQEIKDLFQYITRYTPQNVELEHKLRPFIPDYIPAVGDIDAFLKVIRPENKVEVLGLHVIDEPCAKQSDPTVLDLQLRSISKQTSAKQMVVRSIEDAEKNPKAIDSWMQSIADLHRQKPPQNVHYTKTMPDIESLMQEWPPEFEEMLKNTGLPTADFDSDLIQYIDIICAILDIPVYKDRIQSLHVLFTLYSEFKNSQHFNQLARDNLLSNDLKPGADGSRQNGAPAGSQSLSFE